MSTTTLKKGFDDALARFKVAEKNLATMQARTDETASRLLDAKLTLANLDYRASNFAASGDAGNARAAAELVTGQSNAAGMVSLLERSIGYMHGELTKAKAEVLACEEACAQAQAIYHNAAFAEELREFLKTNRAALQKLTHAMCLDSMFSGDGMFAMRHVEQLIDGPLSAAVHEEFGNDEAFRAGCSVMAKPGTISAAVRSSLVAGDDRARASQARVHGSAAVLAALAYREPEMDRAAFDPTFALQAMHSQLEQATLCDRDAEQFQAKLKQLDERAVIPPGAVEQLTASMQRARDGAERHRAAAQRWQEQLSERSKLAA